MESKIFFRLGGTIWFLAAGSSLVALLVQWLSEWSLTGEQWRLLWLWAGTGGLVLFLLGGVLAIWRN